MTTTSSRLVEFLESSVEPWSTVSPTFGRIPHHHIRMQISQGNAKCLPRQANLSYHGQECGLPSVTCLAFWGASPHPAYISSASRDRGPMQS